ncbi:MAG: hypothetical protein QF682_02560 [Candidatus Thermoplasmatota archaeon]|jgi:hypothetical protein|nr:hypothetical protein [Candidatus Thermoplasmatota archaeon]
MAQLSPKGVSGVKWEPVGLQRKSKAQQCPKGIAERSGSPKG